MIKKLSLGLVCLASLTLQAAPALKAWSGQGTVLSNSIDKVTYFVASANGIVAGPARLSFIQAHSDLGAAVIQFYIATNQYALSGTNATVSGASTTNIPLGNAVTNGGSVISNGVCVIRHTLTDTYERNRFYAGTTTNITFMYPLLVTTTDGDIVYAEQASGQIFVGTNAVPAVPLTIGPAPGGSGGIANNVNPNTPFLMEVNGTVISTQVQINTASGDYMSTPLP